MSNPIWMPLYVRDYLLDTRHLSTLEHGAYLLLIMEYWTKGRLPTDDETLAYICRMDQRTWRRHRATLHSLFAADWRHARIDRELAKANDLRLKRQVYGSMGNAAKRAGMDYYRSKLATLHPRKPQN